LGALGYKILERLLFGPLIECEVFLMSILVLILVVVVLLWAFNAYVPMPAPTKGILSFVVVAGLALWFLSGYGYLGGCDFGPHHYLRR
jgi:uncharacterized membrane-anchored protein